MGSQSYDLHDEYGWIGIRKVPALRMSGEWLNNAGFAPGHRVRVHIAERCITILPE